MNQVKSPLRYPGGKSRAIKQILQHVPAHIEEYREPFVGGGSVFLAMRRLFGQRIQRYVINDLNDDLIHFWRARNRISTNLRSVYRSSRMTTMMAGSYGAFCTHPERCVQNWSGRCVILF